MSKHKLFQDVLSIRYWWTILIDISGHPSPIESGYSYDDPNYDDYSDDFLGEEEEKEIVYDISFTNSGDTITVDKGTTIRLPCNVDKYPGKTNDYNFASSRLRWEFFIRKVICQLKLK